MRRYLLLTVLLSGCAYLDHLAELQGFEKVPTEQSAEVEPTPAPTPEPTAAPEAPEPPKRLETTSAAPTSTPEKPRGKEPPTGAQRVPDGSGGFLAKDGDQTRKIAILLPGKFGSVPMDSVSVRLKASGKVEKLAYHGLGNPDADGDRQHYRGSQPLRNYRGEVVARRGDKEWTWTFKVGKNTTRVD